MGQDLLLWHAVNFNKNGPQRLMAINHRLPCSAEKFNVQRTLKVHLYADVIEPFLGMYLALKPHVALVHREWKERTIRAPFQWYRSTTCLGLWHSVPLLFLLQRVELTEQRRTD